MLRYIEPVRISKGETVRFIDSDGSAYQGTVKSIDPSPDGSYDYKIELEEPKPKTVAEEILEIIASEKNTAWKDGPWHRTCVALAEAVEWIEESRSFDGFCGDKKQVPMHERALDSILAILKRERKKVRENPKS